MIQNIYDNLWAQYCAAVDDNRFQLDPNIINPTDNRRGITALAYLAANNHSVCQRIDQFLHQAQCIEPEQYYQPFNERHLTLLSIITCAAGFNLTDINSTDYIEALKQVLHHVEPIEVEFRGVTASPACIMIQGFPVGSGLNDLRDKLRQHFSQAPLASTIDSRYKLITAHCSVIRFCVPLQQRQKLKALCQQYQHYPFGRVRFSQFELVFNDWYQTLSAGKSLAQYSLSEPC
ncbi:2'-5' RNA ligase family protein [Shewanella youngdeokensis]|uniref:Mutarotase n=1 Tax=Shewanella youngdeokensis TaxID=2999068 RepID=A0ABZ0JXG6_9GAMM|nr:hypothetical protein RGE70_12765 [Shewanella sp. DAU334]